MAWTFVGLSALSKARKKYEFSLASRAIGLREESSAQKILKEDRDFGKFLKAREKYEVPESDPMKLPVAYGAAATSRPHELHEFAAHNFKVIYHCDQKRRIARAIHFYRVTTIKEQAHDFWNWLTS